MYSVYQMYHEFYMLFYMTGGTSGTYWSLPYSEGQSSSPAPSFHLPRSQARVGSL